jgi:hypothetical protein
MAGLVVVLVGVSGFALWSSRSTAASADAAVRASRLSDECSLAAGAVAAEESLERKYRLEPGPAVLARYDQAAADLVAALTLLGQTSTARERPVVDQVLSEHGPYLQAVHQMFGVRLFWSDGRSLI